MGIAVQKSFVQLSFRGAFPKYDFVKKRDIGLRHHPQNRGSEFGVRGSGFGIRDSGFGKIKTGVRDGAGKIAWL